MLHRSHTLAACCLLAASLALPACTTRRTSSTDTRPASYHPTTDPFGGARLSTGTGYRENKSADPHHNADYFKTPPRGK